jgi:ribosome maturation factor RimP
MPDGSRHAPSRATRRGRAASGGSATPGGRPPQTPPSLGGNLSPQTLPAPSAQAPSAQTTAPAQTPSRRHDAGGSVDLSRITDVIEPVIAAAGMDLESLRVTAAGRRRLLRVVVDSDRGVSLDDAAAVSRELSAALDTVAVMGDFPYTLEVSSPGVDRPLTERRHWRRAAGRLVRVAVADYGPVVGRIVSADADGVTLDVEGDPKTRRRFAYAVLGAGAVQVEFGHPQAELGASGDGH